MEVPSEPVLPIGQPISVEPPLGLEAVSVPEDNPITAETVAPVRNPCCAKGLSVVSTIAFASCADPNLFWEGVGASWEAVRHPP